MSSKKAMKQAQIQNYARFKNNFTYNLKNPFIKKNFQKGKKNVSKRK